MTLALGGARGGAAVALFALVLGACSGAVEGPPDEDGLGPDGSGGPSGGTSSGASGGQGPGSGGNGSRSGSGGSGGSAGSSKGSGGSSQAGDGSGNSAGVPEIPETCDPSALASETPLRRIGRTEYLNTLRDLLEPAGLASEVDTLESELEQLPADGENQHLFSGMDNRLSQRHVDAYYGVADALAKRLTTNEESLTALAGDCASDAEPSEACVRDFIESFGARVFRRPLTSAEVDRYLELRVAGTPSKDIFFGILFTLFLSPDFLYHLEIQGEPLASQARVLALSGHEKASRLSYLFWRSMPDQELSDAADAGELDTDEGFESAAERVFDDPRTKATLREFWGEWLGINGFAGFIDGAQFEAFADGVDADDALFDAMSDETHAFIEHFTWDSDGSYRDVLTSPLYFSTSRSLSDLYGVEPWSGSGDAPSLPSDERSGLLTRAALVVEGNAVTNPIKRGAFILKQMLCETIDPPSDLPAEALALPPADPSQSTRERFETKTSAPECRGCHSLINPLGFSLEVYDALGRYRTEERVYADDGDLLSTMDIDPEVEIELDGTVTPASTPLELTQAIAASQKAYECLARQYFRYTMKRDERAGDACTLTAVRDQAGDDGSLRATFRNIALVPSFRERVMEEP